MVCMAAHIRETGNTVFTFKLAIQSHNVAVIVRGGDWMGLNFG